MEAQKKKVVLELSGASQQVSIVGHVFRSSDMSTPVRRNVGVRMTRPAVLYLSEGKFVYMFDVKTGKGEFTVKASGAGTGTKKVDTSLGDTGRKLHFRVIN